MAASVSPAVGTVIRGEGKVVHHDVTKYDLHRMCVAVTNKYPDIEIWLEMLKDKQVREVRYTEKLTSVFIGYLWFYWKEG